MRRRLARRRDTFDAASLPRGPDAELCHRTAPTSRATDLRGTLFVLAWQVGLSLLLVLPTKLLAAATVAIPAAAALFLPLIVWHFGDSLLAFLRTQPFRRQMLWILALVLAWPLYELLSAQPTFRQTYLFVFGPAVAASAVLSHVIAKQFAFWMSVNERLEKDAVGRWQGYWGYISKPVTPEGCPEVESYRVGFLALVPAYVAGLVTLNLADGSRLAPYAGLLALLAFALAAAFLWCLWSSSRIVPWMSPWKVASVAWRGVVTWFRYNHHQTVAPGVFQFPTVLFRPVLSRQVASIIPLFLLTLTLSQMEGPPWKRFVLGKAIELSSGSFAIVFDADAVLGQLTPSERSWHEGLPEEARTGFLREVWDRRLATNAGDAASRWTVTTIGHGLLLVAGLVVGPVLVFLVVFTSTTGRLLVAFHEALEAPDAWEVRPDAWPWDNRVERLMTSRNPLERDHVYLGRSIHGDYPVLLHLKLLQQHAHILGDTGSRKTSVGIAPLMSQLIGRADASVLVLDLKGDKGLFECARAEAARAGMPFRFFTNIADRPSHIFNPLQQSHSAKLTVHQRTQSILQALSLEYGEGYGEGFYSAVNEIVLKQYLDHYKSIDSIRKLDEYVGLRDAYRKIGGVQDDWKNARHLAILLDKLASVHPLNVARDDVRDRPEAWEERIDMPSLLETRQVVYFYLSSAMEPTTVSPVARLAMFNLLTAAAPLEGRGERVYIFVDEFQRIVTENVRLFLEQARSMKLHFILANQTMGQLRARGMDLVDTVESCTAYKHLFKATDLDTLQRLEQASGEALYHENQWKLVAAENFRTRADMNYADDEPREFQTREAIGPRLERNTLIELSAAGWTSLVRFTEGSGYTQYGGYFTPIVHEFHVPREAYEARLREPWPAPSRATVVKPPEPGREAAGDGRATPTEEARSIIERLDDDDSSELPPLPPVPEVSHE